jgi:hypothetical protein
MAKRNKTTSRADEDAPAPATSPATNGIEQRVVDFAEQLGRIAGTVQAKAEGWMDRETLSAQLASVRDGAVDLLAQLGLATPAKRRKRPAARAGTGRSGGTVDAPGKKHRKRLPADPDATRASSQAAKMRAAKTMEKTSRRRARA